ncbi:protease modulator HflC [Mucisphaera calidilacus]|uniref:Protein HflC n=1 Tax=Mucisphaera calidilacus TaxID=2527982 RepID=A0A518BXL5_9BACT|nr:protease modulator HflC [Mucisphaera calidilacus]QDU71723.1 Modulator of FtsH protease HflC [Mucisphaera calidilacus]
MIRGLAIILFFIVIIVLAGSLYQLDETEQAVILRFQQPVGNAVTEAGIHFKLPFIDDVRRFDKRLLAWDGDPNQIPTLERQFIKIDTTARWRIIDPLLFLQRVRDESGAQSRLDDVIDSVVRDSVSSTNLAQLVQSSDWAGGVISDSQNPPASEGDQPAGREELEALILRKASANMDQFGIELVDVRIKRVNYVPSVQARVFDRMITERQRVAQQYRSEGEGEASRIQGETQRDLAQITSSAQRDAEIIRGKADAEATNIYAGAYGKDPEFYAFMRTLESYSKTLSGGTTLLLSADAPYFHYLKGEKLED